MPRNERSINTAMKMNRNSSKSMKCNKCKKFFAFHKFSGHDCHIQSHPATSSSFFHISNSNKNNDLQCSFCGLQMANHKVLEIHMTSCSRHRNTQQNCKLCRGPTRLRNNQPFCANCSIAKGESQEYDLRFKATTQTEGFASKPSRTVLPERNIENDDFASNSLIYSKKRTASLSDSQKQKEKKLKTKLAKHQITEKQILFNNLKLANATEVRTGKEIHGGVKLLSELHHAPQKLCKSSVQKKQDSKRTSAEVPFEKFKNNNLLQHHLKTPRRTEEEKQTHFNNLKIANATKVGSGKEIQVGVKQLRELHRPPEKLCRSSSKNSMQQRKDFKVASIEVPCEKLKNNNLQKHFKTSRRTEEKIRPASKKTDDLPGKSNSARKGVTLQLLLNSIPENDCGMLLQSSSANKIDHFYKCCRCEKAFKNIKLGSMHYSNCKSTKFLNTVVDVSDIRWVCTICNSSFLNPEMLLNHLKGCNIFAKKYEGICEKRCEMCHFRCISSLKFQNHNCVKELENMKSCAVRLNAVKINSEAGRVVMRECEFCGEIFDEQFTEQHFHSHHPGERSSGNFKQYFVNLNPGPSTETVVVKTEPVSPGQEFMGDASCGFEESEHHSLVNGHHSSNQNFMMPPPPVNLPILQSSVSLSNHQALSSQTGEPSSSRHSASDGARLINQQICKCIDRNVEEDVKPCFKCLRKFDFTKFTKNFKVIPFRLAKIKQETFEDSGALNVNTQAVGSTAASSVQIGKEVDNSEDPWRNQRLDSYIYSNVNSLTPPSSHNGVSPPSTPTAFVQSSPLVEPCSASDVSAEYLNDDISMIMDEPSSSLDKIPSLDLIEFINNDHSSVIPLMQCSDNHELFTPICEIMHVSDVDDYKTVDAWAVVSSESSVNIDKYICSQCIHFSCLDKNSLIRHLYENHEKKLQYIAMYLVKTVSDCNKS